MSDLWGHIRNRTEWTFWCADCHQYYDYYFSAKAEAIKKASIDGWRLRKQGWVCPKCTNDVQS